MEAITHRRSVQMSAALYARCATHNRAAIVSRSATPTASLLTQGAVRHRDMTTVKAPKPLVNFEALKGVLFDIDGTITDSDHLHFKAFQQLLAEVGFNDGVPITLDFFNSQISGGHNPEISSRLFPTWTLEQQTAFSDRKEKYFRDLAGSVLQPMPGLHDFLDWLEARGIRKLVVTNAPRPNAELMLSALKLNDRFEHVVLGEECARAKPFPDPYLTGLALLGTRGEDSLVFEDSLLGVTSGVAAGIPVIGVLSTQKADALHGVGATAVVKDFVEVMAMINGSRN